MKKIIVIILYFCWLLLIWGCQSTARFINKNETYQKYSNTDTNKKISDTSDVNIDTNNYNVHTKIIYPKELSSKYSHKIINIAEKWIGTPYLYGGNTKAGIDCSGLVRNVFLELGIDLPHSSAQQYNLLKPTNTPVVGDLVFFKKGNIINHVGIFIGDNKMIHSSSSKGVIIQTIIGSSLENRLAGYRKAY